MSNTLRIIITIALASIPSIFLLHYVYLHDKTEKEPKGLLIRLFIGGCLSVIPILIMENFITRTLLNNMKYDAIVYNFVDAFICAAFSEELWKFTITKLLAWKKPSFNSFYDGMIYCVFTSMGFATIENIFYAFSYGVNVLKYRSFLAIPGHFSFAIVMGLFMSRAKQIETERKEGLSQKSYRKYLFISLFSAIFFHGLYDFCLMNGSGFMMLLFALFTAFFFRLAFNLVRSISRSDRYFVEEN